MRESGHRARGAAIGLHLLLLAMVTTLAFGRADSARADGLVPLPPQPADVLWPTEAWPRGELPEALDRAAFDAATKRLLENVGRGGLHDTRALLIVRGGRLVYEHYADGFGPASRFQSWSMAKSITQALVGVLVREGKLEVDALAPVREWHGEDDPRRAVKLDHLLHMTSGLANADGFPEATYAGEAIFGLGARSPARFAMQAPLEHPIGTHWAYSTGTSMIVAALAGLAMGQDEGQRLAYMRRGLFEPIGMRSAVPEFDTRGHFMGGGFFYATAEDWARFGYLYLRDGVWDGRRILPEGWVDYSRTPAAAENNGIHGAHFWVNAPPAEGQWELYPGAPGSAFAAEGNSFQIVAMVPTHDLLVVRLGELDFSRFFEQRRHLGALIASFPPMEAR